MRILLLGGGAREHALGWKLAQGHGVTEVASAPGNPGLAELGPTLPHVPITDPAAVLDAAHGFDLVVVGPEAPLAAGVVDRLEEAAIPAFGPTKLAARLETSKAFAKRVMHEAMVPTAAAAVFHEREPALHHLSVAPGPYVVKADGLAGGKGVLVTEDPEAAADWVHRCFDGGFGPAGHTVVIEEYLHGPEVSVFAICAGDVVLPLEPARDYKRLGDGDAGPNTGGMGCFSPVDDLPEGLVDHVVETIMRPVLARLAAADTPYRGFLYTGLVLTSAGPKVLEFNCRLGDPETQVVLPRLDADLAGLLEAAVYRRLLGRSVSWHDIAAVDVVLAASGYPVDPRRGDVIEGVKKARDVPGVLVFHAGTSHKDGELVTAGGRVLNVVGTGPDIGAARSAAYEAADLITFPGKQYRGDIASGRPQ